MKPGKSIVELAQELTRRRDTAKDFIVPTGKMEMALVMSDGETVGKPVLNFANGVEHKLPLNKWSHGQVAEYSDIPRAYYERIRAENPALLVKSVNHGFSRAVAAQRPGQPTESRMVRTIDGKAVAFLSAKYRRLDSHDLAEAVLPLMAQNDFQIEAAEITDRRLYIKAVTPKVMGEVKLNDVVQYGLSISTSDVGDGALTVDPLIYRIVCKNGAIMSTAVRKTHLGRSQAGDNISELLSDRTKELSDAAFWAQIRDVVSASMRPEIFQRELDKLKLAAGEKITNYKLEEVVELAMDRVNVHGEKTKDSILAYLANGAGGAGLTKWGLANAFTWAAQSDHVDYDTSTDLERAGGKIIELARQDWEKIATSA